MATTDTIPTQSPTRVHYSTGRLLGVEDFQADQDYHRGRLARALVQLYGTGTASGLLVQTGADADGNLEIQVTPGMAIDRIGRIIEVPRTVCIVLNNWLTQLVQGWQNQQANPVPGQTVLPDPNSAIHDGKHLMCDVFASFAPCTRGVTPCFAAQDDYDATDAFSPNRWLDSFAMQLVLRTDTAPLSSNPPLTPVDPWKNAGAIAPVGANVTVPTTAALQNLILGATLGAAAPDVEYPPHFDTTAVFLARMLIAATPGAAGKPPTWDLTQKIVIDNNARLFLYPAGLMARLNGLGSGTES